MLGRAYGCSHAHQIMFPDVPTLVNFELLGYFELTTTRFVSDFPCNIFVPTKPLSVLRLFSCAALAPNGLVKRWRYACRLGCSSSTIIADFPRIQYLIHQNITFAVSPRFWSPVTGEALMDQFVVRNLYTAGANSSYDTRGGARITHFFSFPSWLLKVPTNSSRSAPPICQQCLWRVFSIVIQLQVSYNYICSWWTPIGAHCAPAWDTSVLRACVIPSHSRAIGTDRDEARIWYWGWG